MLPLHDIDGEWLDDPSERWWVSDATGMPTSGAPRRTSLETPGHHGRRRMPAVMSAGIYPITVTIEAPTYGLLLSYIAEVKRILRGRTLTLHPGDGSVPIAADIEVAGELKPVREQHGKGFFADIEAVLEVPSGRWLESDPNQDTVTAAGRRVLHQLTGGSADMSPIIVVTGNGSATNIRVTDVATGAWIGLVGNVTPGVMVAINTDPDVLTALSGSTDYGPLLRLGPRPFYLSPGAEVDVTQNGATFHPVTFTARRAFD